MSLRCPLTASLRALMLLARSWELEGSLKLAASRFVFLGDTGLDLDGFNALSRAPSTELLEMSGSFLLR